MNDQKSFSGYRRDLSNRGSVRLADRVSRVMITVGGIGTILSVLLVCVFLVWVVVPLFVGSAVVEEQTNAVADREPPLHVSIGESRAMAWSIERDGRLVVRRLDTGEALRDEPLFESGEALTAWSFPVLGKRVAFGLANGSIRLGTIGFESRFLGDDEITDAMRAMAASTHDRFGDGLVFRTAEDRFRVQRVAASIQAPLDAIDGTPVVQVDLAQGARGPVYAALTERGTLQLSSVEQTENMMTGEIEYESSGRTYPIERLDGRMPDFIRLVGQGGAVYAIWRDGTLVRYDSRNIEDAKIAERVDLAEDGVELTCVQWLLGRRTLLVGDSTGRIRGWFLTKPEGATTNDGSVLVAAHTFARIASPVTSIATCPRSRLLAAGHANGHVQLAFVTNRAELLDVTAVEGEAIEALAVAPREDLLAAVAGGRLYTCAIDIGHPAVTLASLFTPVWYEGYDGPEHVWQSSSGTDDFEEKFGLWPLVFGTLKATIYSLLFGVPLALLAAVFTSEFMNPRARAAIKPTIELMASLPSVVLGFLAGLVFAPFIEDYVPAALGAFLTVPFAFLFGAYVWQLLPREKSLRWANLRFPMMCVTLPIGIASALVVGPVMEALFFAGDIKRWLSGQIGSGMGGLVLLLLPISAFAVALLLGSRINPRLRESMANRTHRQAATLSFIKFGVATVVVIGLAVVGAGLLSVLGVDPRGGVFDTYVQRNAMVVGFVMGFAIIPIIYTIAEDALSTIPEHLRSASLGAGATPWQTAVRVVIPTAMSGLFSAVMIGLGRAVGETMIVLMAAGNTPVLEMNLFNGFRTLSANIAVELPEAVPSSTHYRTLFLAAFVLFAITFVLNTIAEAVRLRFRKRSHEL